MRGDALDRRGVLAGLGLLAAGPALAQTAPRGALHFEVWRSGRRIGAHSVSFHGDDGQVTATIEADMLVKLGPIPLFRYRHDATESWRGGRFMALQTRSVTNGKVEQVSATRVGDAVTIAVGGARPVLAPANACPLTHWNPNALTGPLFNPQTGALLRESVSRAADTLQMADGRTVSATRYQLHGEAEIADWYAPSDGWIALRGKAMDGSSIEYRRV